MAWFHVYQLGSELAIDLQANLLDGLNTRVMAPLVPETDVKRLVNKLIPDSISMARYT